MRGNFQCKQFLSKSILQKKELLKANKCCFNCLRKGHFSNNCASIHVCNICKQKHYTLIHTNHADLIQEVNVGTHDKPASGTSASLSNQRQLTEITVSNNSFIKQTTNNTVLPTAGRSLCVRALLDQGSQASFVTESVVQTLKADRRLAASIRRNFRNWRCQRWFNKKYYQFNHGTMNAGGDQFFHSKL